MTYKVMNFLKFPPIAPEKMALLSINTTFVVLNLYAWKNGGCPISFFVVQYKAKGQREWVLVSSNLDPRHEEFVVTGLNPATWYNLLMSAHNEAGATEAEYVFATLTVTGGTITPIVAGREEGPLFYRNLSVLVPIVCAIVVLLVITLVILIVCLKKNRNPDYATPSQNQEIRTEQKGDNISMASVGKKVYETPRETLYYPSPYATTRISMYSADSESSSGQTNSLQRPSGTHRAEHTYDVPFPQKFRDPSSYSEAVHDYQQLFTEAGLHHFVESFDIDQRHLIVQRMCLQTYEAKPGHQRSSSLYHQHPHLHNHHEQQQPDLQHQHIYRLNRHSEPNSRFAHDYLSEGNSDEDEGSLSGDKACFQGGGNTTDSHEMSEAECDRDYHQHLRKNSHSPFVKFRIGPLATNCGLCADNE